MPIDSEKKDLYKESGVDVKKGEELVDWLKETGTEKVNGGSLVSGIGGFAALFRPDFSGYEDPLLVSGTDGVGTKLLLGIEHNLLEGLGQDLVAMCVNDLYTLGAKPLFFLDYYATSNLDSNQFKSVLTGIKSALDQCQCSLMGGETAELPGLYSKGHFDLAGFVVGVVDKPKVLGPDKVKSGDKLYSLAANGFHSNGYSLVRKWISESKMPLSRGEIENIMTPTKIYHEIPKILEIMNYQGINALSNITGGGISGNLPRVMPNNVTSVIDWSSVERPKWMDKFIESNGVSAKEVEAVFNVGAGMIASISCESVKEFEDASKEVGLNISQIGEVTDRQNDQGVLFT